MDMSTGPDPDADATKVGYPRCLQPVKINSHYCSLTGLPKKLSAQQATLSYFRILGFAGTATQINWCF